MTERDPKPGDVAKMQDGTTQTVYDCRLSATPDGVKVMVTFERGGYRMSLDEYRKKATVLYAAD